MSIISGRVKLNQSY